jgi:membrane-bound metal-dependent hydrolase YbcI (DUF457 family)
MMMGHYSGAFLAKRIAPGVPLWAAFLGVQLVDIAVAVLVLAGVERVSFEEGLASNALVLEHMPYTHSLLASALWAAAAFAVVRKMAPRAGRLVAWGMAVAVLSHWFGDVLVHRADMSLLGGGVFGKFGLGLWNYPLVGLIVEIGLLGGTAIWASVPGGPLYSARRGVGLLVAAMIAIQTADILGFMPPILTEAELVWGGLCLFLGLPAIAYRAARAAD